MWCPVCKNEYREGFYHCPDCDVDLVESLDDIKEPVREEEDDMPSPEELAYMLAQQGELELEDGATVTAEEIMEAASRMAAEEEDDIHLPETYESKRQKAEDNKSSGFALLLVGVVGMAADVLLFLDMLPIKFSGTSKYLICGVMSVMFIIFIASGIMALSAQKKLLALADQEDELISRVKEFLDSSVSAKTVDARLGGEVSEAGSDEEGDGAAPQIYFRRMEVIRRELTTAFPELESSLMEKLADEHYTGLFGE